MQMERLPLRCSSSASWNPVSSDRKQTAFQQDAYATLAEKAAALLQGVSIAHPFFDGNKRAALGAALLFMELNGVRSIADQDALYDLVIEVTTGRLREVDEIAPRLKELFAPDLDGD